MFSTKQRVVLTSALLLLVVQLRRLVGYARAPLLSAQSKTVTASVGASEREASRARRTGAG